PTLCGDWTTRDLLAHLLVRERRPDAAGGILIRALAGHTAKVQDRVAARDYTASVEQFRNGPPLWTVWALPLVGDRANLAEFFVHHEDIRRAQSGWQPRPPDAERDDALWGLLKTVGRMLYRRSPVGVVLRAANRAEIVARKGEPHVTIVGEPGEIVLHAYGRADDVTRIVVEGDLDRPAWRNAPRHLGAPGLMSAPHPSPGRL
ncbi:MAG TPA: TIGR03085 family metal-binding protein, partial [Ilumatobacteraceae bacterium]|nr:TIGR03085 family metal-binding protein [Ilumatobacteraceae bacterium]